jgi:hypothetical protein
MQLPKKELQQPRLNLENLSRKHAGLYVCTADNGIGRPAIGAIYVRVLCESIYVRLDWNKGSKSGSKF